MRGRLAEETTNKVKGNKDIKVPLSVIVIERKKISTAQRSSAISSVQKCGFYVSEVGSSVVKGSKGDNYS